MLSFHLRLGISLGTWLDFMDEQTTCWTDQKGRSIWNQAVAAASMLPPQTQQRSSWQQARGQAGAKRAMFLPTVARFSVVGSGLLVKQRLVYSSMKPIRVSSKTPSCALGGSSAPKGPWPNSQRTRTCAGCGP